MPATFQSASSAAWVPDLSPREMNGAALALIAFSPATMSLPLAPAGSLLGPTRMKSLYITGIALHAEAVGDEFLLLRPGVHEHHVGVAAPAGVERLAGALRHHLHVDAGLGLEQRQDMAEQAGVLRRGGGGDHDRLVLRERGRGEQRDGGGENEKTRRVSMALSSFRFQTSSSPATKRRASCVSRRAEEIVRPRRSRPRGRDASARSRRRAACASPRSCVDITTLMPRAATRGSRPRPPSLRPDRGSRSARRGTAPAGPWRARAPARAAAARRRRACAPAARRACEADQREQLADARCVLGARNAGGFERVADVGGGAAPEHHRALEHDGAVGGAPASRPPQVTRPRGRRIRPMASRRSVVLPAPFGPISTVGAPGRDRERDGRGSSPRAGEASICSSMIGRSDGRCAHGHPANRSPVRRGAPGRGVDEKSRW